MPTQCFKRKWSAAFFLTAAIISFFANPVLAGVYPVTTTNLSGAGSLYWAITNANANPGLDTINFDISGSPPFTIAPTNALPQINETVTIDGTTQTGYSNVPIIELNGSAAGVGAAGLKFAAAASFSTVRGLVINRFTGNGIELNSVSNTIAGNYVGTDITGTLARGNGTSQSAYGIYISSVGNRIGGTNAADRNVISGNNETGIYINAAGGNTVQGNWIGVTASNSAIALGNTKHGIIINNSSRNVIGGTNTGAGNVISGNTNGASGIYLRLAGATGNWIQCNHIGIDITGANAVGNTGDGITLDSAPGNQIGPSNIISGNSLAGVSITGLSASNNLVTGNYIGTDITGRLARSNYLAGVSISGAGGNQIGGTNTSDGNIISGNNYYGIQLLNGTVPTKGTIIQGNFIGVSAGGTNALRNGWQGILLSGAISNTIGGTAPGARNIISGNASNGVYIANLTDTNNVIQGNYIGTDVTGLKAIANGLDGVHLQACGNLIGGTNSGCRNVISGNANIGVSLVGAGGNVAGNIIQGNFIGLDATGNTNLPNNYGVGISDAANNQIGGTVTGSGNVISGNSQQGVFLTVTGSTGNQIQGNFIGTDATGTGARGNNRSGIDLEQYAGATLIGGSIPGAGNVISANGQIGNYANIFLSGSSANVIQGNFIGTKADGVGSLTNFGHGIDLGGSLQVAANNNIIGGTNAGEGNHIGYMQTDQRSGVRVRNGSYNNLISGNSIFSNAELGIDLGSGVGVSPNVDCESGMSSSYANYGQNYPVLTNVVSGSGTRIRGYLNSGINKTYRLQFFASANGNPLGNGEGQVFLGEKSLVLGGNCTTNFNYLLPVTIPTGWVVTATATDPANNTSEFSAYVYATNVPTVKISGTTPGQPYVSWTNSGGAFTLQQSYSLNPPVWVPVTNVPVLSNGNYWVNLSLTNTNVFYHLLAP